MIKQSAGFLAVTLLSCSAAAFAAGGGESSRPTEPADPAIEAAQAAIAKSDWSGARKGLTDAIGRNPQKADYHNLLAYVTRKGPNPDMNLVFKEYNEALRLDPKHKGAHEYIGEAYLMVDNLPKAKEHLAELDKLCFFSCDEFTMLKKSIADYEAKKR